MGSTAGQTSCSEWAAGLPLKPGAHGVPVTHVWLGAPPSPDMPAGEEQGVWSFTLCRSLSTSGELEDGGGRSRPQAEPSQIKGVWLQVGPRAPPPVRERG